MKKKTHHKQQLQQQQRSVDDIYIYICIVRTVYVLNVKLIGIYSLCMKMLYVDLLCVCIFRVLEKLHTHAKYPQKRQRKRFEENFLKKHEYGVSTITQHKHFLYNFVLKFIF